jgi:DNA-directed RNA polymerase subunit M/transcription elongation factor TFIIS
MTVATDSIMGDTEAPAKHVCKETCREKIRALIKTKTKLKEKECEDMEIGIYNWSLDNAKRINIVCTWNNPQFYRMYIEKARSILTNVDPKSYLENKTLLPSIKKSEYKPHEICFLSPEKLHPTVWSDTIELFHKKYENAFENNEDAVVTEMLTCGKCKKNRCTFYEKQIRSGDEGMTIFIRCLNCNNRWRM